MDADQAPAGVKPSETVIADRYTVRSPLGQGAFATTFLGDDRYLNRPVVIKLLNADERQAAELFKREIGIIGALSHRNIVNILDVGFAKDGRPYYVSEWVDGKDLGGILAASGPLGTKRSLQAASGIAEALAYVHSRGFVHRDLKPSNILIPGWPYSADYTNPKILDFGVAGLLSHGQTAPGMVFGTPRYMAPEQVLGQPQSSATDIYGLGLLLFEMLTGQALRRGVDQPKGLFRAILQEEVSEKEFEAIPSDCVHLIRRCIRRVPEERPAIDVVLRDLRRLEALQPPDLSVAWSKSAPTRVPDVDESVARATMARSIQPTSRWPKSEVPAGKRWIWMVVIAVAFFGLVAGTIALYGRSRGLLLSGGLVLIVASIAGALWLRRWLDGASSAKEQAHELALGAKARVDLTATIALHLDDLVCRLRTLDEQILAGSVALMLDEYGRATEAKDRQSALMNVVVLSEKLAQRLSPWYVRYKDVIASAVAVLGAVSGLLTTINALGGPHKP